MDRDQQAIWEQRHSEAAPGEPEPSLVEMLPLMPRGLALDVAAGTGRNSIAMARAGSRVIAADFSLNAMRKVAQIARADELPIRPMVADLSAGLPFRDDTFDVILNVSYLERALFPALKSAVRCGGMILFDTFLIDQAASGHPRNPRFLLGHYELYDQFSDMELIRYREGIVVYPGGKAAWRAVALARRK
jgi:SAM-dependent methyltransferase